LRLIALILRLFSYLFEFLLAVVLLMLGILDATSGNTLDLGMLPWTGPQLTHWLTGLGLIGLVCTVLAVAGWFRPLFPLWTLFVVVMAIRGYFISPYAFTGPSGFQQALWFTVACLLGFIGSLTIFGGHRPEPLRR